VARGRVVLYPDIPRERGASCKVLFANTHTGDTCPCSANKRVC